MLACESADGTQLELCVPGESMRNKVPYRGTASDSILQAHTTEPRVFGSSIVPTSKEFTSYACAPRRRLATVVGRWSA